MSSERKKSKTDRPHLIEAHFAELRRSGLTDATISISGIKTLKASSVQKIIDLDAGQGWRIRYPQTSPIHVRVKPDVPYKTKDGKLAKYISPPGSKSHLYLPPNLDPAIYADTSKRLAILEGEKKSLLLNQEGIPAIAVAGVWAWLTKDANDSSVPVKELDFFTWQGREAVIIWDSDAVRKPGVMAAEWAFAQELERRGARVLAVRLPGPNPTEDQEHDLRGKFGADDLFYVRGKQALVAAISGATKPQKPAAKVLESALGGGGDQVERTAIQILKAHHFAYVGGGLHVYRDGVYVPGGQRVVEHEAHNIMKGHWNAEKVNSVVRYIELESTDPSTDAPPTPDCAVINVANGLLDLGSGELEVHDPRVISLSQVPVRFRPKAKCPAISAFLNEILPGPGLVDLVLEMIGYFLVAITSFERAFMLVGKGRNGKSTLIKLIVALLGKRNVSHIALQDLENKFRLAEIHGKLLNTYTDLDSRSLKSTSVFKAVVSGDPVTAEKKFKDPFAFRPYSKLLYSCNEIPYSEDHTPGYYRRWIMVPFDVEFPQPDRGLLDRLTGKKELSGLLNLAIGGLKRLVRNGDFTQPDSVQALLNDQRRQENNVLRFLEACCIVKPKAKVKKKVLYGAYEDWCAESGVKFVMNDARFAKALVLVVMALKTKRSHRGNDRWLGLRLRQGVA